MRKSIGLIAFLKGSSNPKNQTPGCANYDDYYGGCVYGSKCKVEQKERCEYFERSVLPSAKDIGLLGHVTDLYEAHVGANIRAQGTDRRCECGVGLKPRQRYCPKCSDRRRRASYRKSRKKAG